MAQTQRKYRLIFGFNSSGTLDFEDSVNRAMRKDWKLSGGVSVDKYGNFQQAMYK